MNSLFLINILMALVWAAITGSFSLPSLLFGFALSALADPRAGRDGWLYESFAADNQPVPAVRL